MEPRVIRLKNAPTYLGMNKNLFNSLVRPNIIEVRIGNQGVGFDRFDLDSWFEDYKSLSRVSAVDHSTRGDIANVVTENFPISKKAIDRHADESFQAAINLIRLKKSREKVKAL